ncbi:cardiolipin synthase (CMP-forming) isoform X1 [Gymnogyps californianus]|uniref:cardiolipin synthase (CMP-forming) isoform X1 n=1 Tax=Gymnogyps californianus TaxID=33616 RepID=UPI0021C9114E|nr:cardiolipin synthase (CMP-forming) isoform X1 [Gymnogyps californianus]
MLAAAWLGRDFWGLLRGAGRRRPGGGARPLASRPGAAAEGRGGGAGGRRHGNSGVFCLAAGAGALAGPRAAPALRQHQRLLREHQRLLRAPGAAWRLLSGGAGPRRAGSGGAAPPEPPRERRVAGRYAEPYENPWTIPNILSMARMGLAPVLGYLIVEENFNVALGVFVLAGITDLLDGFIARNWANQKSALGSALDPLADKILISVLYVSLTCANLIPVSLTSMIILRDVALIAAVFYVRYKTLSPPRTLSRYFNPCYATAQLKPTFISKMNTAVQLILVAASLAAPVFNYVDSIYLQTLWCITAFTTVASAYSYYHYGRKTVQVINNK